MQMRTFATLLCQITFAACLFAACGSPEETGAGGHASKSSSSKSSSDVATSTADSSSSASSTTASSSVVATTGAGGGAGGAPPVPGEQELGKPCTSDAECGPLTCIETTPGTLGGAGPEGGLCTKPCLQDSACPEGGVCVDIGPKSVCLQQCTVGSSVPAGAKCRGRKDMGCLQLDAGVAACIPACISDASCGVGLHCNYRTGLCQSTTPAGDPMGRACNPNGANTCAGTCICLDDNCTEGACSGICSFGATTPSCGEKEGTGLCLLTYTSDPGDGDIGACVGDCQCTGDCAPDFVCNGFVEAQQAGMNGVCYFDLDGQTFPQCCDCSGKVCGDDGCGTSCGSCAQGETCVAGGQCCASCEGKACGPDGCGGTCGTCAPNAVCDAEGQCQCIPDCSGKVCGDDGCGGTCGSCAPGQECDAGACCTPSCAGKVCGDDGCGGTCGACASNETCDAQGQCQCVPACAGKTCGPNGCGSTCGSCAANQVCTGGDCCTPSCFGKNCGPDGCGGTCGACAGTCNAGVCCQQVQPCSSDFDCCGEICGIYTGACYVCLPLGELCGDNAECCSGACNNGQCNTCLNNVQDCTNDAQCCSGYCGPNQWCTTPP